MEIFFFFYEDDLLNTSQILMVLGFGNFLI